VGSFPVPSSLGLGAPDGFPWQGAEHGKWPLEDTGGAREGLGLPSQGSTRRVVFQIFFQVLPVGLLRPPPPTRNQFALHLGEEQVGSWESFPVLLPASSSQAHGE
jgi:hypothetical protein